MRKAIVILASIMLSSSLCAEPTNALIGRSQFLLGLSAGPTWATGNKTQTIHLEPDVQKTYTANNHHSNTFTSAELFLGWQTPWDFRFMEQSLISQLGMRIAGAGNAKLKGDIWEDADPDFDNFNYRYKVNHAEVAIKGRLISTSCLNINSYISGSVGAGFNRAYDFKIQPKIVEEVAAPPFASHTTTTFSYTLGIGLQTALTQQLQAAIGYEFADWGKIKLSPADGQTVNQALTLSHLYTHQIQLSLFYFV